MQQNDTLTLDKYDSIMEEDYEDNDVCSTSK